MPIKVVNTSNIAKLLIIILAIAIQIQLTLFGTSNYLGLRINMADLIIPFAGILIFASLILKKSTWPQFNIRGAYVWLTLLGLVLAAALVHNYINFNEISKWGLQNKLIGWIVLSCLFLLGSWLRANTKEHSIIKFFEYAAIFLLIIMLIQAAFQVSFFSFKFRPINNAFTNYPMAALLANKNSFVFFFLCILSFLSFLSKQSPLLTRLNYIFWMCIPLVFFFTGARSAFIAFPFFIIFMLFLNKELQWKKVLCFVILGTTLCAFQHHTTTIQIYTLKPHTIESISHIGDVVSGNELDEVANKIKYHGDSNRLKVLHHVISMIKESPVLGSGLGSILLTQEREHGEFIDLMDCTILWLWAETGIFGLALFLAFYFLCFKALWMTSKDENSSQLTRDLSKGAILMLVIFGVMSLFHELLYSRFLWLFLGMMLALPRTQNQET